MVNLDTLDLNLLRIFDAIMEERSVLRAGRRLGLSQSAVSHALNRLRYVLKDELFVRTSAGMQPTARAIELSRPLRQALLQIGTALGSPDFEPATARRRFVIAANDYVTTVFFPKLISFFKTEVPHIDLIIRPSTRGRGRRRAVTDRGFLQSRMGALRDLAARRPDLTPQSAFGAISSADRR